MAFEVEAGTGSPTATSYVSVAFADDYVNTFEPSSPWGALSTPEKEAELQKATRFLDLLLRWTSRVKDDKQALSWPRDGFTDREGRYIDSDVIPKMIKEAVVEFAMQLVEGGGLSTNVDRLSSESFGDSSDTYATPKLVGDETVMRWQNNLVYVGYGGKRTTIARLWRA